MSKCRPIFQAFYIRSFSYKKALQLQRNLIHWMKDDPQSSTPTLLLLQHHPVYTVGRRNDQYSQDEQNFLESLGADFVRTNRGGLITFHGPGQLVVYPVFSMRKIPITIRTYVCKLEQAVINLLLKYNLKGTRSHHTGVWIGDNKICAMGINAQQRVCSHGIALNCNTDLSWFSRIVPCGIKDKGVTSLSLETGKCVTVEDVLPRFLDECSSTFEWEVTPIQTFDQVDHMDDDTLFFKVSRQ